MWKERNARNIFRGASIFEDDIMLDCEWASLRSDFDSLKSGLSFAVIR